MVSTPLIQIQMQNKRTFPLINSRVLIVWVFIDSIDVILLSSGKVLVTRF